MSWRRGEWEAEIFARSRNIALEVIVPHVLGAVEHLGREFRLGPHHLVTRADAGPFAVETSRNPSGLYLGPGQSGRALPSEHAAPPVLRGLVQLSRDEL